MRRLFALCALLVIASTDPVKDTRQIMAGTVSTTSVKNEYLSGVRDTTASFKGALEQVKKLYFPPAWVKCADEGQVCNIVGTAPVRYGAGTTWVTKTITTSVMCNNTVFGDPATGKVKTCETSGTVAPAPTPTPTPTPPPTPTPSPTVISFDGWKYSPLIVGSYAWTVVNQPKVPCCKGIVSKIVEGPKMSTDSTPVPMWRLQFFSDVTGNFPADDAYMANQANWWQEKDIVGIAPDKLSLHSPLWNKELIATGAKVRAIKTCPSIFENAETLRNNIPQQGVVKGEVYQYVSWGYWRSDVATVQSDDRLKTAYVYTGCLELVPA